ncbi:MAG: OmpA family protein [Kofleriaceae bacterium]
MASTAGADPRLEASGFVGVSWFGRRTELGNSWAPEQVPHTSPVLGGRLSWLALPSLPGDLQLAIEGELAFAPAFTGDRASAGRMSYFAPVFGWRGHALLRLARWREIEPHLVGGGGGETVASSSPFMSKETDPVAYWGAGVDARLSASWRLRVEVRHGVMPARDGGATSMVELQAGVGVVLGAVAERHLPRVEPPPVVDQDSDGDGIVDRLDRCPTEPETVNGVADDDGCPEPDPDGDGLVGAADHCPDAAEDFDGFEDSDGCPDPDNDQDGIDDKLDGCPLTAETRNGFEDEDGCPDQLPAELTAALATQLRFEPARARVTARGATALQPLLAMLWQRTALRLAIVGRPARAGGDALAKRRADAVKWYLVDQGIPEDRIETSVDPAVDAKRAVTFALIVAPSRAAHEQ